MCHTWVQDWLYYYCNQLLQRTSQFMWAENSWAKHRNAFFASATKSCSLSKMGLCLQIKTFNLNAYVKVMLVRITTIFVCTPTHCGPHDILAFGHMWRSEHILLQISKITYRRHLDSVLGCDKKYSCLTLHSVRKYLD